MDNKETIKERLDILPPELRAFVLTEKWREDAQKIGKQFNFDEVKYASFENEIFLVLLCFEPKNDFTENIKKELEIDSNMAGWIVEDIEKNIFSKVTNEIEAMWQAADTESIEGPEQSEGKEENDGVGESFEQIILNQAKAMQPAVASPKLGYGVAKPAVDEQRRDVPTNLPTDEENMEEKPSDFAKATPDKKAIHNYVGESDPYREPIE